MANKNLKYILLIFALALALMMIAYYIYFNALKPPIYDPVHKP